MIGSLTQGHLLPMVAPATILCRVGRVDFDELSASFCRFARELFKELRPCRITDAQRKAMIVNHTIDMQIFNTDDSKLIDDLSRVLVREVLAPPPDSFVDTRNHLAMAAPFFRAFFQFRVFALDLCQCLFLLTKEARVGNLFPAGKGCKGFQTHINPNGVRIFWQPLSFMLNRKGDVPFARRGAMNGAGFERAFDRAMIHHFERANLGKTDPIVMGDAEPTLRIGETIIAVVSLKTREAGFFARLAASKEGFEGQIETNRNVLQDLRMHSTHGWALLFQNRIRLELLKAGQRNTIALVAGLTHFEQMIIQKTALFKMSIKRSLLFFCRIDPVAKVFMHACILCLNSKDVKKIPICPITPL